MVGRIVTVGSCFHWERGVGWANHGAKNIIRAGQTDSLAPNVL